VAARGDISHGENENQETRNRSPDERRRIRQEQAKPILDEFHDWRTLERLLAPNGSSTAKAIDYSLKRWTALAHYVDDGQVPIDNSWIENRIRPIARGRKNWLFAAGSLRAGKRAAAIMSLTYSKRIVSQF
jgi:MoxR-like ATPase